MADITMCANQACEQRLGCFRFLAPVGQHQSYGDYKPDENGHCKGFYSFQPEFKNYDRYRPDCFCRECREYFIRKEQGE